MMHVVTFYDDVGDESPEFKVRGPFGTVDEANAYADGMEYVADSSITDIQVAPYWPEKHAKLLFDQSLGSPPGSRGEEFTGVEISTVHITKRDNDILEGLARKNDGPYTVAAYEYGFFVTLPDEPQSLPGRSERIDENLKAMEEQGLSLAFRSIVAHWATMGKRLLRIDESALPADELEEFDW